MGRQPRYKLYVTAEDVWALATLVSTAVWVRSNQIHMEGKVFTIDCHDIIVSRLGWENERGQALYSRLQSFIREHEIPEPPGRLVSVKGAT